MLSLNYAFVHVGDPDNNKIQNLGFINSAREDNLAQNKFEKI